jgi:tRNA threonylcarbamoyladenosine biosynthesis protein TsaB
VNILALDTSTDYCSVALLQEDRVLSDEVRAGQKHSDLLLPMVDRLLNETGIGLDDLDGIAFGAGPGSFTGLRIACAVAQGLAFGAGKSVVAVSTLLALAEASGAERVVAALDARMSEVYLAAYVRDGDGWGTVIQPCLQFPAAMPELPGDGWVAVGSGFAVCDGALVDACGDKLARVDVLRYPQAAHMARLAAPVFASGLAVAPEEAAPLYVRDKVALKVSER